MNEIETMIGKVFTSVKRTDDELVFENSECKYTFLHWQDCCESVYIDDICGDLSDLENCPILLAEESTNSDDPKEYSDSHTWTFYKFTTIKGYVDVKWYGESNGYYSESVNLMITKKT